MSYPGTSLVSRPRIVNFGAASRGGGLRGVGRLMAWFLLLLLVHSPPSCLLAAVADPVAFRSSPQGRFESVDIWVDSGASPLAAYQLKVNFSSGAIKLVGVEGGEAPAFRDPPHFDARALQKDRIVLAAFSLRPPTQLPVGSTRVARLQVFVPANVSAEARISLMTASDSEGRILPAKTVLRSSSPL